MPFCGQCGQQRINNAPCSCQNKPPQSYPNIPTYPVYQKPKKPAGQTMIRVVGILATIFSAIGIIDALSHFESYHRVGHYITHNYTAADIVILIAMTAILGMGIAGIVMANDKSKAPLILGCGIAILILTAGFDLLGYLLLSYHFADSYIWGIPLGVLYIIGAANRKNAPA